MNGIIRKAPGTLTHHLHPPSEFLRPQAAVHRPLLIPHGLKRPGGYLRHQRENVWATEGAKAHLDARRHGRGPTSSAVWHRAIGVIRPRGTASQQEQAGVEVGL